MASRKQVEANRANARRSTGPRSATGKAFSSKNALKHGLLSGEVLLDDEPAELFEELRNDLLRDLAPESSRQQICADRIVSLEWRIRRLLRVERETFESLRTGLSLDGREENLGVGYAFRRGSSAWVDNTFGKLSRYEASLVNALRRAYEEYDRLADRNSGTSGGNGSGDG